MFSGGRPACLRPLAGRLRRLRLRHVGRSGQAVDADLGLLPILIVAQTQLCGAVPTLMFACASNIVYAVFGPCGTLLDVTGDEWRVAWSFALCLVVNIVVAVCAIPDFGAITAAAVNLAGVLIGDAMLWWDCQGLVAIDTSVGGFFLAARPGK